MPIKELDEYEVEELESEPLLQGLPIARLAQLAGRYPRSDWRYEVANGDTKLGYAEWIGHKYEAEQHDLAGDNAVSEECRCKSLLNGHEPGCRYVARFWM
jgi:hypothetical protein